MFYDITIHPIELLYRCFYLYIYEISGSYGISLILLSMLTTLVLTPVVGWAMRIQKDEKRIQDILQPQTERIRSESTGSERHNRIVALYRSYAYHPILAVRSVVGLVLQLPFLIAAYYMLSGLPEIRGQSFLFVKDLSEPDGLISGLNLLPILMTAINLLTAFTTETFGKKEKLQSLLIAFLFLVLLYAAPSALLIFWTFNNAWGLLRNLRVCLEEKTGYEIRLYSSYIRPLLLRIVSFPDEVMVIVAFALTFSVFIPLDIYINNAQEFWFSLQDIGWILAACCVVVICLLLMVSRILIGRARSVFTCLLLGITIGLFMQSYIVNMDYGVLDGREIEWGKYTKHAILNSIMWLACIVAPFVASKVSFCKCKKYFKNISFGILVVQITTLIILFLNTNITKIETKTLSTDKMFNLSVDKNIIIFVLDSFDTDIFNTLLNKYPYILKEFKDFTYYKEAVSAYSMTIGAIPHILTGEWHKNEERYPDFIEKIWSNNKFISYFKNKDYDIRLLLNSVFVSSKANKIVDNLIMQRLRVSSIFGLGNLFYKLSLFRSMPHLLKKYFWIYTGDFDKFATSSNNNYIINDLNFYENLCKIGINNQSEKKCFRIYHLLGAHPPFTLDKNINLSTKGSTSAEEQSMGVLKIVFNYLNKLKQIGLYNNSSVFIIADHGNHYSLAASPLVLIKNTNEKSDQGEMSVSELPISYENLHATIVYSMYDDYSIFGTPFNLNMKDINYPRKHMMYQRTKDSTYLSPISEYFIIGKVKNLNSWKKTSNYYKYKENREYEYNIGENVDFTINGDGSKYMIKGWSFGEIDRTWTDGNEALLSFNIKNLKKSGIIFKIYASAYLKNISQLQKVDVVVNNKYISSLTFDNKLKWYEVFIPSESVEGKILNINLKISNPISPSELKRSKDTRKLGIAVRKIVIEYK